MKKENLKALFIMLEELSQREIYSEEYGQFDLSELARKERIEIAQKVLSLTEESDLEDDGDKDGSYLAIEINEDLGLVMIFFSKSQASYGYDEEEFLKNLDSMYFRYAGWKSDFQKLLQPVRFVNLTPHAINIITSDRQPIATFESEGVARVATKSVQTGEIDGVPIFETQYGQMEGLPEPQTNVFYIVSMLCKQACPKRKDLLIPSQLIRDEKGQPVGCLGLE